MTATANITRPVRAVAALGHPWDSTRLSSA